MHEKYISGLNITNDDTTQDEFDLNDYNNQRVILFTDLDAGHRAEGRDERGFGQRDRCRGEPVV